MKNSHMMIGPEKSACRSEKQKGSVLFEHKYVLHSPDFQHSMLLE